MRTGENGIVRGCDAGSRRARRGGPTCSGADSGRTAGRAVVALGACLAQDLRDPHGLARPLLRGAAARMVVSRRLAFRRLGAVYLHRDPPSAAELRSSTTTPLIAGVKQQERFIATAVD